MCMNYKQRLLLLKNWIKYGVFVLKGGISCKLYMLSFYYVACLILFPEFQALKGSGGLQWRFTSFAHSSCSLYAKLRLISRQWIQHITQPRLNNCSVDMRDSLGDPWLLSTPLWVCPLNSLQMTTSSGLCSVLSMETPVASDWQPWSSPSRWVHMPQQMLSATLILLFRNVLTLKFNIWFSLSSWWSQKCWMEADKIIRHEGTKIQERTTVGKNNLKFEEADDHVVRCAYVRHD